MMAELIKANHGSSVVAPVEIRADRTHSNTNGRIGRMGFHSLPSRYGNAWSSNTATRTLTTRPTTRPPDLVNMVTTDAAQTKSVTNAKRLSAAARRPNAA